MASTFEIDLHAHSRFFHGFEGRPTFFDPVGADLLSLAGRVLGVDAVALTNHDYSTVLPSAFETPQFLPGIEISTTEGHALVVGPDPPRRTTPGELTPGEVVSLAHDRDCAAIIPHPYRRSTVRECGAAFDAVEINGKHPREIERVRELASRLELPVVGGSDAHYPFELGRATTVVEAAELTPTAIARAIREGRVEPQVRDSPADRLVRLGYRHVHRYL